MRSDQKVFTAAAIHLTVPNNECPGIEHSSQCNGYDTDAKTLNSILLFFMGDINFYTYQNFGDKFLLNRSTVR